MMIDDDENEDTHNLLLFRFAWFWHVSGRRRMADRDSAGHDTRAFLVFVKNHSVPLSASSMKSMIFFAADQLPLPLLSSNVFHHDQSYPSHVKREDREVQEVLSLEDSPAMLRFGRISSMIALIGLV
jgi:hypothetical protein